MSADELRGVLALYALAHKPEPVRVASVKEAIAIVDAFELDTQGGAPEANGALGEAAPDWLLRPVLGNAWDLPPEWLLKQMDGGALRVRYSGFRRRALEWQPPAQPLRPADAAAFASHSVAMLRRRGDSRCRTGGGRTAAPVGATGVAGAGAAFGIHRVELVTELAGKLNGALLHLAREGEAKSAGVEVSNVGGWHSSQDMHLWTDGASAALTSLFARAAALAEQHERACEPGGGCASPEHAPLAPAAQLEVADAWLNISRHSNWNKLHTHEGRCWSGVYYVSAAGAADCHARAYSGALLFKPDPAAAEPHYELTPAELRRLHAVTATTEETTCERTSSTGAGSDGVCDYYQAQPRPGTLLLFPSWLLHCVLPLYVADQEGQCGVDAIRVSAAYNFHASCHDSG